VATIVAQEHCMNFSFYVVDIETTGLDSHKHDVIELSIVRMGAEGEDSQRTWCLKPLNPDEIEPAALRVNGHKLEDLLHRTKEGRERYQDAAQVAIEIENWLAEDGLPAEKRFLIGQNVSFDRDRLEQLWIKLNSRDSFPFGRRYMDTMIVELFLDYCKGEFAEGYSLSNLIKKYGVKNEKAHTAAADVKATKEVFEKQVEMFKLILDKASVPTK
jgi:DNA polymerase III epsilon subunit-like protein